MLIDKTTTSVDIVKAKYETRLQSVITRIVKLIDKASDYKQSINTNLVTALKINLCNTEEDVATVVFDMLNKAYTHYKW